VQDNVRTVELLLEHGASPDLARERLESWLDSSTGRGFGRKGLESAREIERMLERSERKGMFQGLLAKLGLRS
jgi:hypothetical protein